MCPFHDFSGWLFLRELWIPLFLQEEGKTPLEKWEQGISFVGFVWLGWDFLEHPIPALLWTGILSSQPFMENIFMGRKGEFFSSWDFLEHRRSLLEKLSHSRRNLEDPAVHFSLFHLFLILKSHFLVGLTLEW